MMEEEIRSVILDEDISTLVHYMPFSLSKEDAIVLRCRKHGYCAMTLCGKHSKSGVFTNKEVTCLECVMEKGSREPSLKKELVTSGKS